MQRLTYWIQLACGSVLEPYPKPVDEPEHPVSWVPLRSRCLVKAKPPIPKNVRMSRKPCMRSPNLGNFKGKAFGNRNGETFAGMQRQTSGQNRQTATIHGNNNDQSAFGPAGRVAREDFQRERIGLLDFLQLA